MNIKNALNSGHSPEEVLGVIASAFPYLSQRIRQAKRMGKDAKELLGALEGLTQKDLKKLDKQAMHSSNPLIAAQTATRQNSAETFREKKLFPAALGLGASVLGPELAAPLIQKGIQAAEPVIQRGGQALQGAIGKLTGAKVPGIGPTPMSNAPVQPAPVNPLSRQGLSQGMGSEAPAAPEPTPQTAPQMTASTPSPTTPKTRASEFFRNLGVEARVEELARKGKTPEEIASDIQFDMHPQARKAYLAKRGRGEEVPIEQHVKEYLTDENGFLREGVLKSEEKSTPLKKGQTVVDVKSGLTGDLHDIKQKEALINDDGKLHKVKAEDLISSPLPEKELAELYDDLIKGIEKETGRDVSRNVNWAGYDPVHNELVYLPHDGSLYTYEDISEEDRKELTNILNVRATTNGNFIGPWEAGSASPIGAALSKLIQKIQKERGGKGKEYSRKYATVYSALEPAVKASKLAFKKRKKNESH